ncbi:MAG: DUF4416 family protein [Pseudomonadota bacterium]
MKDSYAKAIVAILTNDQNLIDEVCDKLSKEFGRIEFSSNRYPFTHTNYYKEEMGKDLFRFFVAFEELYDASNAAELKIRTSKIEDEFRVDGKRRVNLDGGYIDANKLVLITGKHGGHKISLADGIWADMLLWYNKGWQPLPWAFPDFRCDVYYKEFTAIRRLFKKSCKFL